jgi:acetyl-CoA carboxylase biotin carboxylase subunit
VKRVLIANRGEIAVRLIRSCHEAGLETVAVFSEADRGAMHTELAGRAVCIGPAPSAKSYLNIGALITAASSAGCDAVHPGYGFLAENAGFATACAENNLIFVGPDPQCIVAMGDKINARRTAAELGVPTVPGTIEPLASFNDVAHAANEAGFPVLLKAAAGGGGRGMRVVREPRALQEAFERASGEAQSAFGDGRMYIERYLEDIRHIEVQVLADAHGNVAELGERDCSVQRRHQKLIEEAPSSALDEQTRRGILDAAVMLVCAIGYRNAGTVEFVFDRTSGRYFFIEMNTRIQVEHPVTEMITGVDLVGEQLRIADGQTLDMSRLGRRHGHAIECRINAEDPATNFRPSPGRITDWEAPGGEGVRVDTHCKAGSVVPPYYDSLLAKLIVHGGTRQQAIDRAVAAIDDFRIEGVKTTLPFHRQVLMSEAFTRSDTNTRWVEESLLAA